MQSGRAGRRHGAWTVAVFGVVPIVKSAGGGFAIVIVMTFVWQFGVNTP